MASAPRWVEEYRTTKQRPLPPGWFTRVDLSLFALIDQVQAAAGMRGDLLEVGGYLAKSAVALGFMRRDEESVVVIDPWERDTGPEKNPREQGFYRGVTIEAFRSNYLRFHHQPPDLRQGRSDEHLGDLRDGQFRFIHVDGSHEWRAVAGDTEQVLRLLAPGGVVAFDDVFARHAPGVGAAVWPRCATGELVPFATTTKLYATRGRSPIVGADVLARALDRDESLCVLDRHPVFESDVLEVASAASNETLLGRFRRYVPPALVEAADDRNLGSYARRALQAFRAPAKA